MAHVEPIRSTRLVIRPFEPGDRAEYLRVHAEGRGHFAPWMPRTDSNDEALFERSLAQRDDPTVLRLGGFLHDGRLAACLSLTQIFLGPFRSAYAGWRVSADLTGRGLATEGMRRLLDLAFAPESPAPGGGDPEAAIEHGLGLHRVQANIIPRNAASVRVAEKLAMRREGLALRYLQIAGAWEDHLMYAKTAEEHTPA